MVLPSEYIVSGRKARVSGIIINIILCSSVILKGFGATELLVVNE
jgi:hypothetical protein